MPRGGQGWDMAAFASLMHDRLTVEVRAPAAENPNTGEPLGPPTSTAVVADQPCSDQDYGLRMAAMQIANGIPGALGVSRCLTAWFPWPDVPDGSTVAVLVNGTYRPLMKQGPPREIGGQHQVYEIWLGPPQAGRDA